MPDLAQKLSGTWSAETASALRGIGVHRVTTPLPFPQVDHVHAYFIDGGEPALIDTGITTSRVVAEFEAQTASAGLKIESLKKILITHGHIDHYGLAAAFSRRSGAKVYINPIDAPKVLAGASAADQELYHAYLLRCGMPEETIDAIGQMFAVELRYARKIDGVELLGEGETVRAGDLSLRVLNMPGHTPGMNCFLDEERGILFSGDHVLPMISPNPLLDLGGGGEKFRSLVAYMGSLRRAALLAPRLVLPGHGDPVTDLKTLESNLLRFYKLRQRRILRIIADGAKTPVEIAGKLFPKLSIQDAFLAVSEVIGNIEILEQEGSARMGEREGRFYCSQAEGKKEMPAGMT